MLSSEGAFSSDFSLTVESKKRISETKTSKINASAKDAENRTRVVRLNQDVLLRF